MFLVFKMLFIYKNLLSKTQILRSWFLPEFSLRQPEGLVEHSRREFPIFGIDHAGNFDFRRADHQDVDVLFRQRREHL